MTKNDKFKAGDLVRFIILKRQNKDSGKLGFIVGLSQKRRPHRTDVYFVKFQNEEIREVDERWLEIAPDLDGENIV
ncbi:MAG: hypothetical protein ACXABN_16260 [Candidatus Thorarchaeota archaeon]|jgi:hypothetical protein